MSARGENERGTRARRWRREKKRDEMGGRGCAAMPVLCTLQGCCNLPYPATASTSRGVSSPHAGTGCHLSSSLPSTSARLLSLASSLTLRSWNFYESVLSYIWRNENDGEPTRCDFYRGSRLTREPRRQRTFRGVALISS